MTRVFYDFEFLDDGQTIDPISIGMAREDTGMLLYRINKECDQWEVRSSPWLREHVWLKLPRATCADGDCDMECGTETGGHIDITSPHVRSREAIATDVLTFLYGVPDLELWGYYPAYDHVALAQLFGPMNRLPAHIPMRTSCLMQRADHLGVAEHELPVHHGREHHALDDALHDMEIAHYLDRRATKPKRRALMTRLDDQGEVIYPPATRTITLDHPVTICPEGEEPS